MTIHIHESIRNTMMPMLPVSMEIARRHGLPCNYKAGHRPRYVAGNLSNPSEVRVVLLMAEPGSSPGSEELDRDEGAWIEDVTCDGLGHGGFRLRYDEHAHSLYERNPRDFLAMVWPAAPYEERMRQSVIANAFWMQAVKSTGKIPRQAIEAFAPYLARFCSAFPKATVVAAGGKSKNRCHIAGLRAVEMHALTPPGCNHRRARDTWRRAAKEIRAKLDAQA